MTRVLTTSTILATALAMAPMTATAQESDFAEHIGEIRYVAIIDSLDLREDVAEMSHLMDYDGPVVIAQTHRSESLVDGYILQMRVSFDALGPLRSNPIFQIADKALIDGAPLLLTDRIGPEKLMQVTDMDIEIGDVAGVINLAWASPELFEQAAPGFAEGDFLFVTHRSLTGTEFSTATLMDTHLVDPIDTNSQLIADYTSAQSSYFQGHALVTIGEGSNELIRGFTQDSPTIVWVANGPTQDDAAQTGAGGGNDAAGTGGGTASNSSATTRGDIPTSLGEQMNLPSNSSSRVFAATPVRSAPAKAIQARVAPRK